jgi:hypothetical protein
VKTSKAIETGSRDKSICSFSSCTTNSAYPIVRNQKATGSSSVGDGHDRHGHDSRVSARLAARCLAIKGRRSTCSAWEHEKRDAEEREGVKDEV